MKIKSPVHFIGIGGVSMSGLAQIVKNRGGIAIGSNLMQNKMTDKLNAMGIKAFTHHAAENLGAAKTVVFNSVIPDTNPELKLAREKGLIIMPRAEFLAQIMKEYEIGISIAGSHGKTSTTYLFGLMLEEAGVNPTVINGGVMKKWGSNVKIGGHKYCVVETCEAYGNLNPFSPNVAVVTNLDPEHMDNFDSVETLHNYFKDFLKRVPKDGLIILCADHPVTLEFANEFKSKRNVITYGFNPDADISASNIKQNSEGLTSDIKIKSPALTIRDIQLGMFGEHNLLNALATVAYAIHLGMDEQKIRNAFQNFTTPEKRFTKLGQYKGVTIIDDYAHNPQKIAAALKMTKSVATGKVIAFWEPHKYSRTKEGWDLYLKSFQDADYVYVLPIYSTDDSPIDGISPASFVAALKETGHKNANAIQPNEIKKVLNEIGEKGDMAIIMGAGKSSTYAHDVLKD